MVMDWILILAGFWGMIRFVLVPAWKYWKASRTRSYCPSIVLPRFEKSFDHARRIPSRRKSQKDHRVNLYRLTCSCHQRNTRRKYSPPQDIRRMCRHLRKELERSNLLLQYDEVIQSIIDHRVKDACYQIIQVRGNDVALGFHPKNDFVRVYSRRTGNNEPPGNPPTGHYDKFTFLISQEIWIYGDPPPDSEHIIPAISETINAFRHHYDSRPSIFGRLRQHF
ncbi:MAG TPA: hypothetical protein HPQ00_01855 [Magnetococcales bacterium]|nr:hypothetical protein [Magnetococcales bacterium]